MMKTTEIRKALLMQHSILLQENKRLRLKEKELDAELEG